MTDALWIIGPIAIVGGMYLAAARMEPHWVSKDGRRFLCHAQVLTPQGAADGKAREMRVLVGADGLVQVDHRRTMRRRITEVWRVVGKVTDPPPRKAIYLLAPREAAGVTSQIALRLPAKSRAVAVLDAVLAERRERPAG